MFVYFQSAFLWNWAEILVCWIFVRLGICMHIPMENSENEFAIQKKATLRYFFLKSLLVACFPKTWNFGPLVIASQMALWIYIHILSILRLVRSPTTSQLSDLWWLQVRWQLRELLRLLDPTFNLDHDWPHRQDLVCIKNRNPWFLDFLCSTGLDRVPVSVSEWLFGSFVLILFGDNEDFSCFHCHISKEWDGNAFYSEH